MTKSVALQLEFAGLTDVGRSRSRNEDHFEICPDVGLALVCDGMGGHAGGDIASRTTAETIVNCVCEYEPEPADPEGVSHLVSMVQAAVQRANWRLLTLNQQHGFPEGRGMGTTLVGLWLIAASGKAIVFHAGDSRLYRLRGNRLSQLTRDHSLYQAWLDGGGQGVPPRRNIIVRALGILSDVEPDIGVQDVMVGDLFLLCSDGLNGMLSDDQIAAALRRGETLTAACQDLIDQANLRGGLDNVTVVLARVDAAPTVGVAASFFRFAGMIS